MKILLDKSQIALRKCKGKNRCLTAGQLKQKGTLERLVHLDEGYKFLRAVCCKDQLRSCKIEKTDFLKLCQNKGLGELFLKIQLSGRIDFY